MAKVVSQQSLGPPECFHGRGRQPANGLRRHRPRLAALDGRLVDIGLAHPRPPAILSPGLITQAVANGIHIGADVAWLSPLFS